MFGTSAKYLALAEKEDLRPRETHDLTALRAILSTGSPLAPLRIRLRLPRRQARRPPGEHQRRHRHRLLLRAGQSDRPGVARRAADPRARHGGRGLRRPGRPVRDARRRAGVHPPLPQHAGGLLERPRRRQVPRRLLRALPGRLAARRLGPAHRARRTGDHGRSDATLNPGGVRIGTAEIYRQVEQLPEVIESLVVGQEWEGDVRIVLFVRLREGLTLDDALRDRIRQRIREHASPHHVPKRILQVADIPRTISGKITELAVREVIHGRPGYERRGAGQSGGPGALRRSPGTDGLKELPEAVPARTKSVIHDLVRPLADR